MRLKKKQSKHPKISNPQDKKKNYPGKRPQTVCVSVHLREAKVNSHDICSRISASGSFCTTFWHLCKISLRISVWGSFSTTCKISVSGSCTTTCARSLYRDPVGPLYRDPVGPLYQDPVGQLVQDLCLRISVWGSFGPLVSGSCRSTCIQDPCYEDTCGRSLYQDLVGSLLSGSCRTTSVRSLSDPFGPLYQDPVGQLVQDLCFRISVWGSFGPLVSGSCRSTCTRSLLWGHLRKISLSGSCRITSIRIL